MVHVDNVSTAAPTPLDGSFELVRVRTVDRAPGRARGASRATERALSIARIDVDFSEPLRLNGEPLQQAVRSAMRSAGNPFHGAEVCLS